MKNETKIKPVKAWAVALSIDDHFIPDFNVQGFAKNILQIHSDKISAERFAKKLNKDWVVLPVLITPITKKGAK